MTQPRVPSPPRIGPSRHPTRRWFALAAFAIASMLAVAGPALGFSPAQSPPDATSPTVVSIDVYGVAIYDIDDRKETFVVEARLYAAWDDPRQAFEPPPGSGDVRYLEGEAVGEALKTDVWWPSFEIVDARGSRDTMQRSLTIDSDGWVSYEERFIVSILQDYDLERFPFDTHTISFSIEPYVYDNETVLFEAVDEPGDLLNWEPNDWIIEDPKIEVSNDGFARATVSMKIERVSDYYITNIVLPLMLIVLISTAVFSMSFRVSHVGDRLGVSFTGVLTVVAFDFVTTQDLPRLWYSTALDQVITASYVFLAINVMQNVLAARIDARDPEAAVRLDRVFRWGFPAAYVATVLVILGAAMSG